MRTVAECLSVTMIVGCSIFVCVAQDKIRTIEQPAKFTYPNTPIQVEVSINGKLMQDRKAKAGPDWLRKISLEITNISGKDINSLWINLTLREPVVGVREPTPETAGIVIPVELRHIGVDVLTAGDRISLKPSAAMVDYWTKYAGDQGVYDIEKVILDIRQIGFTDDTLWTRGRLSRRDPKTGRFVFISKNRVFTNLMLIPDQSRFFF